MTWVLITGATSGIGRAAALRMARSGARVIATGRSADKLARLEAEARDRGTPLRIVRLDVADAASLATARARVAELTGGYGVDVLVNNAGFAQMGPIELSNHGRVAGMFETNVVGLCRVTRAFVPAMRERGRGTVINVSSVLGRMSLPCQGVYGATKHAVEALSDALRRELRPFGVKVVTVQPGPIATGFDAVAFGGLRAVPDDPDWAPVVGRLADLADRNRAIAAPPEVVGEAILQAATSRDPEPRVTVPRWAESPVVASRVAPAGLREFALRRGMLGIDGRAARDPGRPSPERWALVTGAAGGIGRATVTRLATAGYRVLATDVNQAGLSDLTDYAQEQRLPIEGRRMDVTDERSIAHVAADVARRTDGAGLSLLVNNAGYAEVGPIELVDDAGWRAQLAVNVYGLLSVTRAFAPAMRRRRRGRIVNISSVVGVLAFPFLGVYSASKHAVEALTDALRIELGGFGVKVSAVQPAFIRSGFAEVAKRTLERYDLPSSAYAPWAGRMDAILDRLDRLGGEPNDVARAVHRAATEADPAPRYRTPLSAAVAARVVPWLPTRTSDKAMARFLA